MCALDDYYWLRNREDPAVRAYLEAENAWLRESLAHTAAQEEQLFEEIKGRIRQTDMSVPYREGAYLYHRRYEDGREYPIHCRRALAAGGAPGGGGGSSRRQRRGGRPRVLRCRLAPGESGRAAAGVRGRHGRAPAVHGPLQGSRPPATILPDLIPDVTANVAWAAGSDAVFYARQDPETLRPYQILRHRLGDDPGGDRIVYEESDPEFSCAVWRSRSQRYILIGSFQTVTTEIRYLDAADPEARPVTFLPRERGHEYEIDHYRGRFYIRTNAGARNFRLMVDGRGSPGPCPLARVAAAPRRRAAGRLRAVSRAPGGGGTARRPDGSPRKALERSGRARDRIRRACLRLRPGRQPRTGHHHAPVSLQLDGDARVGLRLRHDGPHAHPAQA